MPYGPIARSPQERRWSAVERTGDQRCPLGSVLRGSALRSWLWRRDAPSASDVDELAQVLQ